MKTHFDIEFILFIFFFGKQNTIFPSLYTILHNATNHISLSFLTRKLLSVFIIRHLSLPSDIQYVKSTYFRHFFFQLTMYNDVDSIGKVSHLFEYTIHIFLQCIYNTLVNVLVLWMKNKFNRKIHFRYNKTQSNLRLLTKVKKKKKTTQSQSFDFFFSYDYWLNWFNVNHWQSLTHSAYFMYQCV